MSSPPTRCAAAGSAATTATNTRAAIVARRRNLLTGLRDMRIGQRQGGFGRRLTAEELPGAFEIEIDHRRDEQRQQLRDQQSADHGEAERPAQLGARAEAD